MADTSMAPVMAHLRRLLSSWARPHVLLLAGDGLWDTGHGGKPYADFGAWCAAHPGRACELWTGASVLADIAGGDEAATQALRTTAGRLAWARRVLHHYHGEAAEMWPLLPWPAAGAWGASALRGVVLAELQAHARAHGVALRAVRPLWPQMLAQLLKQLPALRRSAAGQAWLIEAGHTEAGQAETGPVAAGLAHLTRVGLAQGRVVSVQRRRLQAPWATALQRLLDEEPQAAGVAPVVLWLGPAPQGSLPLPLAITLSPPFREAVPAGAVGGPDFLRPQVRPGLLAWAWLGTCAAVLALAAGEAREAWTQRAQVQTLVIPAAVPRAAASPVLHVDPAELVLRQRLQHPWKAVFLASEAPATAGLRWLSLDHRAGAELRLQGLASDAVPVQLAATALRRQPDWQQVLVARLEAQPAGPVSGPGQGPPLALSFEIVARLREATP